MRVSKALAHFKTVEGIAQALGLRTQNIYRWIHHNDDRVPEKHVIRLHLLSAKAVPIDPDDYWKEANEGKPRAAP